MGIFNRRQNNEDTQKDNLQEVKLSDGISYTLTQKVDCLGDS